MIQSVETATGVGPIGVDIVEIPRIRKLFRKHPERFVETICSRAEKKRVAVLKDPVPYLAERWALKEAIYKLLHTDLEEGISWKEISVTTHRSALLKVRLSGIAKERAAKLKITNISVSISQTKKHLVAFAIGHNRA